jgi:hypothetical protein
VIITLDSLIALVVYLGVVGVATERVTDIVKLFIRTNAPKVTVPVYVIQAISVSVAMCWVALGGPISKDIAVLGTLDPTAAWAIAGVLGGAGSSLWHDLLKVLISFKSGVESTKG